MSGIDIILLSGLILTTSGLVWLWWELHQMRQKIQTRNRLRQ